MVEVHGLNDPHHWLERAEEARNVAAGITDPAARAAMFRIAEAYEQMAARVQSRPLVHVKEDEPSLSTVRRGRNRKFGR